MGCAQKVGHLINVIRRHRTVQKQGCFRFQKIQRGTCEWLEMNFSRQSVCHFKQHSLALDANRQRRWFQIRCFQNKIRETLKRPPEKPSTKVFGNTLVSYILIFHAFVRKYIQERVLEQRRVPGALGNPRKWIHSFIERTMPTKTVRNTMASANDQLWVSYSTGTNFECYIFSSVMGSEYEILLVKRAQSCRRAHGLGMVRKESSDTHDWKKAAIQLYVLLAQIPPLHRIMASKASRGSDGPNTMACGYESKTCWSSAGRVPLVIKSKGCRKSCKAFFY